MWGTVLNFLRCWMRADPSELHRMRSTAFFIPDNLARTSEAVELLRSCFTDRKSEYMKGYKNFYEESNRVRIFCRVRKEVIFTVVWRKIDRALKEETFHR